MARERWLETNTSTDQIFQFRFEVFSWPELGESLLWVPHQPEVIPPEKHWQIVRLSSIPGLPRHLEILEAGERLPCLSAEAILKMAEGSCLHQLYSLGLFMTLDGRTERVASCFPTLKSDSQELAWLEKTVDQARPVFEDAQAAGLEVLWREIFSQADEKMRNQSPILVQPESEVILDEVFRAWQESNLFDRGYSLISWLQNLEEVLPHDVEKRADHLYFELGVICFIDELNWILVARLDELVSARSSGEKRKTFAVDFKSGQKPDKFTRADFVYHLLMAMIAERVTAQYLLNNWQGYTIAPGSGYIKISIKNFLSEAFTPHHFFAKSGAGFSNRAQAVLRYLDDGVPVYEWASLKKRETALRILRSWREKMRGLSITSI